jgi:zinc ribbon protein
MVCKECGSEVSDGSTVCPACGAAVESDPYPVPPEEATAVAPALPASRKTKAAAVVLGEDEVVWRDYELTRVPGLRWNTGGLPELTSSGAHLYVTDSRLVVVSTGSAHRGSLLVQEVLIEDVDGIAAYVSRGLGALGWMIGLIALIASIHELIADDSSTFFTAAWLVVLATVVWCYFFGGKIGLRVYARGASPSSVELGMFGNQWRMLLLSVTRTLYLLLTPIFGGSDAIDLLLGFPGADADRCVSELSALVFDLKRKGPLAEARWKPDGGLPRHLTGSPASP